MDSLYNFWCYRKCAAYAAAWSLNSVWENAPVPQSERARPITARVTFRNHNCRIGTRVRFPWWGRDDFNAVWRWVLAALSVTCGIDAFLLVPLGVALHTFLHPDSGLTKHCGGDEDSSARLGKLASTTQIASFAAFSTVHPPAAVFSSFNSGGFVTGALPKSESFWPPVNL